MKCLKCNNNNNDNANYCYNCGIAFTDNDRNNAQRSGFLGLLRRLHDLKSSLTFSTTPIKIIVLLCVIFWGVYSVMDSTSLIKLVENDNYSFRKDDKTNTYYLFTSNDETSVDLDIPSKTDKLSISVEKNKVILSNEEYKLEDGLILKVIDNDTYYHISYNDKHDIYIYVMNK